MMCPRKSRLAISFILACMSASLGGAEPNETKVDLKFETNSQRSQLWIGDRLNNPGRGPIRPTHVAVLNIRRPNTGLPLDDTGILQILNARSGKALSEQQRKFLTASDAVTWWGGTEDIQNHDMFLLYAISEEDAKKTVQAFLEVAIDRANILERRWKNLLRQAEEKTAKARKEFPDKEAQAEAAKVNYQRMKRQCHKLFPDSDAVEEAKQTILEMNRNLNALDIEIKGIEAKLSAVEEYKSKKNVSLEGLAKLEQILSEQMVELAGALARKEAAIRIRTVEEEFYKSYAEWSMLDGEVHSLREDIRNGEDDIHRAKQILADPGSELQPPVVYQNKVTIYPVLRK